MAIRSRTWPSQSKNSDRIIYSDSRIAMGWVRKKKCNTKLKEDTRRQTLSFLSLLGELKMVKAAPVTTPNCKMGNQSLGRNPGGFW